MFLNGHLLTISLQHIQKGTTYKCNSDYEDWLEVYTVGTFCIEHAPGIQDFVRGRVLVVFID